MRLRPLTDVSVISLAENFAASSESNCRRQANRYYRKRATLYVALPERRTPRTVMPSRSPSIVKILRAPAALMLSASETAWNTRTCLRCESVADGFIATLLSCRKPQYAGLTAAARVNTSAAIEEEMTWPMLFRTVASVPSWPIWLLLPTQSSNTTMW